MLPERNTKLHALKKKKKKKITTSMNVQSFYSYSNSDSITFESLGIIFNSISETSWTW